MAGKCSNGKCNDFDGDKDNAEIYEVQVRVRAALGMLALTLFLIEIAKLFCWREREAHWKDPSVWACRGVCVCTECSKIDMGHVKENLKETSREVG